MATRISVPTRRSDTEPLAPFLNVLRAEWTKLTTHRNTFVLLIVATIVSIGTTALSNWSIGYVWDDMTAADQASIQPLDISMLGMFFAGILMVVISANVVTNEYSSGMINQSMTVTPRRSWIVLAKMLIVNAFLLVPTFVLTYASVWVGQLVLAAYDVPTADVFGSDFGFLAAVSLSGIYYPILTVALAFLFRSSATTISVVLMMMFFPAMFGGIFPRSVQENVLAFLPGNALDAVVFGHRSDSAQYLDQPLAAVVAFAWVVLITGLAIWQVNRRDVG